MKKRLLFLLCLLMVSCNNINPSSSSISESSSFLSSESSSQEVVFNKEYIISTLNSAAKNSYKVNYIKDNREVFDVFNEDYLYVSYSSKGYIKLDSYDKSFSDTILYNFYLVNDKVEIGTCLTTTNSSNKIVPVSSIDSVNYFSLWDENKFTEDLLINAGELGMYSENKDLIDLLAGVLGYYSASSQGAFEKVFFLKNDNGLGIELEISSSYVSNVEGDKIKATLSDIGNAHIKQIDDYLLEFNMSEDKLTFDNVERIVGNNIHLKAKYSYLENEQVKGNPSELEVKIDGSHIYTTLIENGNIHSNIIEKALEYDVNGKYAQGDSISSFVDGLNNVVSYSNGVKFDDYIFPSYYKNEVLNAFVKIEDNKYHYFGYRQNEIASALLRSSPGTGNERVFSLDIELKDGKAHKMYVTYDRNGRYASDGITPIFSYYKCEIELFDLTSQVEGVTPYEKIEGETEIVKKSFDELKSGNVYYHAEGYDVLEKANNKNDYDINEIYVTEDTVLIHERKLGVLSSINGWHKKEGKIIPFVIQKDKQNNYSIIATKPSEIGELSSYIPWNVSENVFELDDANNIIVRNNVINIHQYMYVGPYAPSMVMSSLKMQLNDQGRIDKITYDCDNVTSYSYEQVDIDYDNYDLPNEYQELLSSLEEFKTPASWKEESSLIYERIVYFLGEENAHQLPYLYDEKNFGIRSASVIDDVNTNKPKYLHIYTSVLSLPNDYNFYNSTFVEGYKVLLESLGYTKQENMVAPHNGEMYLLNKLLIEVCKKDVDGIYVSKSI